MVSKEKLVPYIATGLAILFILFGQEVFGAELPEFDGIVDPVEGLDAFTKRTIEWRIDMGFVDAELLSEIETKQMQMEMFHSELEKYHDRMELRGTTPDRVGMWDWGMRLYENGNIELNRLINLALNGRSL